MQSRSKYVELNTSVREVLYLSGKYEYEFENESEARKFADFLQSVAKKLIHFAEIEIELITKSNYIVALSEQAHFALEKAGLNPWSEDSFAKVNLRALTPLSYIAPIVINNLLKTSDLPSSNFLHYLFKNAEEEKIVIFIRRLFIDENKDLLLPTLSQTDNNNKTPLDYLILDRKAEPQILNSAIEELSSIGLFDTIFKKPDIVLKIFQHANRTIFHTFLTKLEKIDYSIDSLPIIDPAYPISLLHSAAEYLKPQLLPDLLEFTTQNALEKVCKIALKENQRGLIEIIAGKSPASISSLLSRVSKTTASFLLFQNKKILSQYQYYDFLEKEDQRISHYGTYIMSENGDEVISYFANKWANGYALEREFAAFLVTHQNAYAHVLNDKQKEFINALSASLEPYANTILNDVAAKNKLNTLAEEANLDSLWKNGIPTWKEVHDLKILLKYHAAHTPQLTANLGKIYYIINTLDSAGRLLTGANMSFNDYLSFPDAASQYENYQAIFTTIQQQQAILKIIKEDNFADFAHQLEDYKYRPVLRKNDLEEDRAATLKYVHLTDEIVAYKSPKINKRTKKYTGLKKQSFTLLSSELNTKVFGQQHEDALLVGIMFNQVKCLPAKGFLKYDTGTYPRAWVGNAKVHDYANNIATKSFKTLAEFQDYVKKNPTALNEILARVTREACMAVVMAKFTPEALRLAKKYVEAIQQIIHFAIPIIIYDNKNQHITIYSDAKPMLLVAEDYLKLQQQNVIATASEAKAEPTLQTLLTKDDVLEEKLKALLTEIASSSLSRQEKNDATKVMNCFIYLNNSLEFFKTAVEHKDDRSKYPEGHQGDKDFEKRVFRDYYGTSFHVNHENSTKALQELRDMFEQFKDILAKLDAAGRLEFAAHLRYDKNTGCLDARISGALMWGVAEVNKEFPNLHTIMKYCLDNCPPNQSLVNFTLAYCTDKGYSKVSFDGTIPFVTSALIASYVTDILCLDLDEKPVPVQAAMPAVNAATPTNPVMAQEYSGYLAKSSRQVLGLQGMLQHHFATRDDAQAFVSWLKNQDSLKALSIHKAAVTTVPDNNTIFCVRVSDEQYNAIMGAQSYAKLLPERMIKEEYAKQDLNTILAQAEFLQEINQRRLLHYRYGNDLSQVQLSNEIISKLHPAIIKQWKLTSTSTSSASENTDNEHNNYLKIHYLDKIQAILDSHLIYLKNKLVEDLARVKGTEDVIEKLNLLTSQLPLAYDKIYQLINSQSNNAATERHTIQLETILTCLKVLSKGDSASIPAWHEDNVALQQKNAFQRQKEILREAAVKQLFTTDNTNQDTDASQSLAAVHEYFNRPEVKFTLGKTSNSLSSIFFKQQKDWVIQNVNTILADYETHQRHYLKTHRHG